VHVNPSGPRECFGHVKSMQKRRMCVQVAKDRTLCIDFALSNGSALGVFLLFASLFDSVVR
jgi:hypothetical protein